MKRLRAIHPQLPRLLGILSITQIVGWGTLYYANTLFLAPMQAELGWSQATLTGAYSAALLASGLAMTHLGAVQDRFGARRLMSLGSLCAGLLLIALSQTRSVAWLYACWVGIGFCMASTLYQPAFAAMVAHLGDAYRRGIILLTLAGGLASTAFYPITRLLIDTLGWRSAWAALGFITLFICVPLHFALPPHSTTSVHADDDAGPRLSARDVMRMPIFWVVAAAFTLNNLVISAFAAHTAPLLTDAKFSASETILIASLIGPMQVAGRLLQLFTEKLWTPQRFGVLVYTLFPISFACLLMTFKAPMMVWLFVLVFGAGNGMMTILRATTIPTLFGKQNYATLQGLLGAPGDIARAAAPFAASLLLSATGDYRFVIGTWFVISLAACGLYAWVAHVSRAKSGL